MWRWTIEQYVNDTLGSYILMNIILFPVLLGLADRHFNVRNCVWSMRLESAPFLKDSAAASFDTFFDTWTCRDGRQSTGRWLRGVVGCCLFYCISPNISKFWCLLLCVHCTLYNCTGNQTNTQRFTKKGMMMRQRAFDDEFYAIKFAEFINLWFKRLRV